VERGTDGVQSILRSNVTFMIPALLEMGMSLSMISFTLGIDLGGLFVTTMLAYSGFTIQSTLKRIEYFQVNNTASDLKFKTFLESLDNFEIIK